MKLSLEGIVLLKMIEEFRGYPYDDQTGEKIDVWVPGATIGYGHLIRESEWDKFCGRTIDYWEADRIFAEDIAPFENCVTYEIKFGTKLPAHKFDPLVILAYNIGQNGFKNSSAVKLVNDEHAVTNYDNLENAWMAWNKSQGKVMRGLINRRTAEWRMYSDGIYERW